MRTLVIGLLLLATNFAIADDKAKTGELALEIRLPRSVESGEPFALSSVFVNTGKTTVSFAIPEHLEHRKFPVFVFTDAEGQQWRPYDAPFQSRWTIGLHGEVVELAPGAKRVFDHRIAKFVRVQDPNSQKWNSPAPLRAGTYTVTAVYEQKDNELVYGVDRGPAKPFASEKRAYPGLWTGKITARPFEVEVSPPRAFTLTIDSPYELHPDRPFELNLELRNGSDKPFVFDGSIQVIGASKAYGSGALVLHPPGYEKGKSITIGPGKVLTWNVDIGTLDFEPGHRAKKRGAEPKPLAGILHKQGIFLLHAKIVDAEHAHVTSNELWRMRKHAR